MLEIKIPLEIREYKGKWLFGFSGRKFISLVSSAVTGGLLGFYGSGRIPDDIHFWVVVIAVAPIILWGFKSFKGMNLEEFIKVYFNFRNKPQRRIYEDTDLSYQIYLHGLLCEAEIRQQRIDNGEIFDEDYDNEDEDSEEVQII